MINRIKEYIENKKLEKTAGIFSKAVKGSVKYNLKNNKLGLGVTFGVGYAGSGKIGAGVTNALEQGYHIIPGVSQQQMAEHLKKRPVSGNQGERGQISEELIKIKK